MNRNLAFLTIDQKGRATLPEEVRSALGVEAGDQLWFHHPEMQARVRRAEADLEEGRSTRTTTPGEAQALLDSLKKATADH